MNRTKIEWTDATWNPVTGCTSVSEGCANCYARRMAKRLRGRYGYPADDPFRVTLHVGRLYKVPSTRMVFVCSMSDLFHEAVPFEFIARVYAVMENRPQTMFQVLTKRPGRRLEFCQWVRERQIGVSLPLPNVWEGITAENQKRLEERWPLLAQTPDAVRFVSLEPLLGPVDVGPWLYDTETCLSCGHSAPHDSEAFWPLGLNSDDGPVCPRCGYDDSRTSGGLDWVICGGETGPGARPMHPDWPRVVRDQCVAAGVPFFFKQWGAYVAGCQLPSETADLTRCQALSLNVWGERVSPPGFGDDGLVRLFRVGKKAAGRLLDGRKWDECPEGRQ